MSWEHLFKPWLVQRVMRKAKREGKGIDGDFAFDYMGSAEFEFGAVSRAVRAMRAEEDLREWKVSPLRVNQATAWYAGGSHQRELAERFFEDQLSGDSRTLRLKEPTYIADVYGIQKHYPVVTDTIGWLVLDAQPPFAFFRHHEDALLWLELVQGVTHGERTEGGPGRG